MKNKVFSLLLVLVFALSVPFSATANKPENKQNQPGDVKPFLKQEMEQKKEAIKNSVESRKQNAMGKIAGRVDQFIQNIIKRFTAAVERFEKLAERIGSRIEKLEANEVDVSESKELFETAKEKIAIAKGSILLISIPENVASTTASTTVSAIKEAFETTKEQIEKAKSDLKDTHAALVDVIVSLKPGDKLFKFRYATSTATTTSSD